MAKKKKKSKTKKSKAKRIKEKVVVGGRFNPVALGITFAIIGVLYIVVMALWTYIFPDSQQIVTLTALVYRGYSAAPAGILIGMLWVTADCFLAGFIIGHLYNWLASLLGKKKGK